MNYKEFQESSKRTLAKLASKKEDLSHMVMGICSEISELEEAISKNDRNGIGEELADIQWYISNYNNIIGTEYVGNDTVSSDNIEMLIKLLYSQCSLLQDLVKKYLAYNKEINSSVEKSILYNIEGILIAIYNLYGISCEEYMEKNILKLKARYPDKFENTLALNRNLEVERNILEA